MRTSKRAFLLAAAFFAVTAGHAGAQENQVVRLGTDGVYAPFNSADTAGKLVGFEPDLFADLCARVKRECEWVVQPFDGIIPALNEGRFEAVVSAMSITAEREKAVDFTRPYYAGPTRFIVAADSALGQSLVGKDRTILMDALTDQDKEILAQTTDLFAGVTVGVERSTNHAKFFEQTFPTVTVKAYDKKEALLLDLVAGRVDVAVEGAGATYDFITAQAAGGKTFATFGPAIKGGALGRGVGMAFKIGENAELRELFNQAITDATADGTVGRLSMKWIGIDGSVAQ